MALVASQRPVRERTNQRTIHLRMSESIPTTRRRNRDIIQVTSRFAIGARLSTLRVRAQRKRQARVRRRLGAFGHGSVEEWRDDRKQQIRAMDDAYMRSARQHRKL